MKPGDRVIHISGQRGIVKKMYRQRVLVFRTDEHYVKTRDPSPRGPVPQVSFSRLEDWSEVCER